MVNVEPYEYQRKTNLKEHNDLVAKINEIVDVINNSNLDTLVPKITALENDVSTINATDSLQWTDIESLKDSQSAQDVTIGNLDTQVKGVAESLVSNIAIIDGITTGNMKVRVERVKATPIDSNDYNIQKPVSMELIQGSGPSTFKAQITLSDGTIIRSDDFMFTTEAIGTDVYISSFVFKNGNVAGTISADIGLSNGTTIEANNFVVPMDPSLLNTVQDLSTRLSTLEGAVGGLNELKATVDSHTASINALDSDVANLQIAKADVSTVETLTNSVNGKVSVAQGTNNAGKVLGINASGNVEPTEVSSGGEVWVEISPYAMPTNWVAGDRIKVAFNLSYTVEGGASWTNNLTSISLEPASNTTLVCEFIIKSLNNSRYCPIESSCGSKSVKQVNVFIYNETDFNKGSYFRFNAFAFNGVGLVETSLTLTSSNLASYVSKMWRLKK